MYMFLEFDDAKKQTNKAAKNQKKLQKQKTADKDEDEPLVTGLQKKKTHASFNAMLDDVELSEDSF